MKLLVEREEELRWKKKVNFDQCHRDRDMSPELPGDMVWIPDRRDQGTVGDEMAPRSYEVETPSSTFRRNRRDIIHFLTEDTCISPRRPEGQDFDSEDDQL